MEPAVKREETVFKEATSCGDWHSEDKARAVTERERPRDRRAPLGGAWTQRDQGGSRGRVVRGKEGLGRDVRGRLAGSTWPMIRLGEAKTEEGINPPPRTGPWISYTIHPALRWGESEAGWGKKLL